MQNYLDKQRILDDALELLDDAKVSYESFDAEERELATRHAEQVKSALKAVLANDL